MGARPYFPFYHSDYLGSSLVQELSPFEEWVYMRCLIHCGASGSIPADIRGIQSICKYQPIRQITQAWERIKDRFQEHPELPGRLINARMDKANGWLHKQQANGQKGGRKTTQTLTQNKTQIEPTSEPRPNPNLTQPPSEPPSDMPTSISNIETPYSPPQTRKPKLDPNYSESFLRFWAEYPEKTGKGAAWSCWQKLKPDEDLTLRILRQVATQRQSKRWRDGYIPNPATWLNQRRWEDETSAAPNDKPLSVHDFL